MKKLFLLIIVSVATLNGFAQRSGFDKLDEWTKVWKEGQQTYFGYPVNQQSALQEFYEWYVSTGMDRVNLNNAGDPMTDKPWNMSTQAFEREVIEFFTPLFGGELAHVVVMQHVTKEKIDGFIRELKGEN